MTHVQLSPTIPLETSFGKATAHVMIDYGEEHYVLFVCFIDATGECRTLRADQVKMQNNQTMRPKENETCQR